MSSNSAKRVKKLSQDFIGDSDDSEVDSGNKSQATVSSPGEQETEQVESRRNAEGEPFFEISGKRRVTIRRWRGSVLIDIREYWEDGGELKPGKKGISLSVDQWKSLVQLFPSIDHAIEKI